MESGNNLPNPGTYPGGDRQQFCVSWNSHQSNMHSAFPKLLSSEQFVDVTLACDGGSIKCHKVVLSACSDYLERLLLEIPCTHPVIFLRDMKMWELQALVEFMYRGEVYVEQQQLATLMQAAEVLQVRGLSTQGCDNSVNESNTQSCDSNAPVTPSTPTHGDSNYKAETSSNDGSTSDFLPCTAMASTGNNSASITPPVSHNPNSSNFVNMEHSEALQHLEKALSACEATLTETPGMVKMEPDEQFVQQQDVKPYSISMVSSNNCNPSSPFPAIEAVGKRSTTRVSTRIKIPTTPFQAVEMGSQSKGSKSKIAPAHIQGYQRRQRRSEEELKQASDMVARGMTFQVASEKYKIPISTIRFYMVRKGILQRRKRGRGSSNLGMNSQPSSPASPPYHMMNYRLPESLNSSLP